MVVETPGVTAKELFDKVHGKEMLHQGTRRTWLLTNKLFPVHKVSISKIAEMVDECPECQKFRLGIRDQLTPIARVLKPHCPQQQRQRMGIKPSSPHALCALARSENIQRRERL